MKYTVVIGGYEMSTELQSSNAQNKISLWSSRIAECRNSNQTVRSWCESHEIAPSTYYKWQRQIFELARRQQETKFAEITPIDSIPSSNEIAVTLQIGSTTAQIHNGADAATIESVWKVLRSC